MEEMRIDVIMAIGDTEGCRNLMENFEGYIRDRFDEGYVLGKIEYVFNKNEFELCLGTGQYSVGIVMEKLNGEAIGQGTLKKWKTECPTTKVILVMDDGRIGSAKVNGLYEREYYNGIFNKDVGSKEMIELFYKQRSKKEAYHYYDIPKFLVENPTERKEKKAENTIKTSGAKKELKLDTPAEKKDQKQQRQEEEKKRLDLSEVEFSLRKASTKSAKKELELHIQNEPALEEEIEEELITSQGTFDTGLFQEPKEEEKNKEEKRKERAESQKISTSVEETKPLKKVIETEVKKEKLEKNEQIEENRLNNDKKAQGLNKKGQQVEMKKPVATKTISSKEFQTITEELNKEALKNDVPEKETIEEKPKSPQFEKNRQIKKESILDKLEDREYLTRYIDGMMSEAIKDHKENKKYEVISNPAFIKAFKSFEYQNEATLNAALKGGIGPREFLNEVGPIIDSVRTGVKEKEEAQSMFFSFTYGYDILESLIRNDDIADIHVTNYNSIRVITQNTRKTSLLSFCNEKHYQRFVKNLIIRNEKLFTVNGLYKRYIDKNFDGKYILNVTIIDGSINSNGMPELLIRKSLQNKITFKEMIGGKMNLKEAAIIANAIQMGDGILLCGPNQCGATTLLNGMIDCIPKVRNAIVMQHQNELFALNHPEITIWNPILNNENGKSVGMKELCNTALELDCDYYILGDVLGEESYSLYKAANYGYTIWTIVRSNSCENALYNLSNMIIDAYPLLDRASVLNLLSNTFKLVVYMEENKIKTIMQIEGGVEGDSGKFKLKRL